MLYTVDQIVKAKSVNLPSFLMMNGVHLRKVGVSYLVEDTEINIKDNAPGELGKWYNFHGGYGGDNIDALKVIMNKEYGEAMEMLLSYIEFESIKEKTISIISAFEDLLDKYGIVIPNEDRDEDSAAIYGTDYFELEYTIKSILTED